MALITATPEDFFMKLFLDLGIKQGNYINLNDLCKILYKIQQEYDFEVCRVYKEEDGSLYCPELKKTLPYFPMIKSDETGTKLTLTASGEFFAELFEYGPGYAHKIKKFYSDILLSKEFSDVIDLEYLKRNTKTECSGQNSAVR